MLNAAISCMPRWHISTDVKADVSSAQMSHKSKPPFGINKLWQVRIFARMSPAPNLSEGRVRKNFGEYST
jgi:hypothetical protein